MINSFLPMGYQPQTDEQIKDMDINVEKDRTTAKLMIMQGIAIPEDLEKRLLEYKDADMRDKQKCTS